MNLKAIIEKFLRENEYDGLCNCELECGCGLDDLMPCDEPGMQDCEPARRVTEKGCGLCPDTVIYSPVKEPT